MRREKMKTNQMPYQELSVMILQKVHKRNFRMLLKVDHLQQRITQASDSVHRIRQRV